uniref:Doublecortin domain-containing protein n=1 Tax=Periophthalmus magnuspinnatus TaxID=409849 RepID=A0A3B4AP81_9GOBI
LAATGPLPDTKNIIVYRNGDGYFVGRKIVVYPRVSTLDILLDYLSSVQAGTGLGQVAQFGAVRRLYTVQGLRVRRLNQVEAGGRYVAAGFQLKHVVVFTNGEVLVPPVRIRVPKYTLKSWDNVLAMVTEKVCLRSGAVHGLCTMDGRPLSSPAQLRNQQHYVAVGTGRFKALPYDQRLHNRPLNSKYGSHGYEKTDSRRQSNVQDKYLFIEGSVFAAQRRRSELAGATEVQEDGWLSMGLPTDQVNTILKQQDSQKKLHCPPYKY